MKIRKAFFIMLLAALFLGAAGTVSAHAELVRAEPRANALLATAPTDIKLWFSEPVEAGFSEIQVVDANHNRLDTGNLEYVAGDRKAVWVALQPLRDGQYTVIWKVLSATDGHITRGVYAFAVGNVAAPQPGAQPALAATTSNGVPETAPLSVATRWLNFLAVLALAGAFFFRVFLLERGLAALRLKAPRLETAWRQFALGAWGLALASGLLGLALQASAVADVPLLQALSPRPLAQTLFDTHYGVLWLARNGLLLLLGLFFLQSRRRLALAVPAAALLAVVALWAAGNPQTLGDLLALRVAVNWQALFSDALGPNGWLHHLLLAAPILLFLGIVSAQDERVRRWIAPATSAVVLATISLGGHAAGVGGEVSLPVLADWLHLTGVALWVGGLFSFFWAVRNAPRALAPEDRARWIAWMVPQFSLLAITATGVIALTGLLNTLLDVQTLAALLSTTYGLTLMVKVALFAVMIGLGALNLLWLSPSFRKTVNAPAQSGRVYSRFRVTMAAEVTLGAGALFLAGLLTLLPPARSMPGDQGPDVVARPTWVYLEQKAAPEVRVELTIRPDLSNPSDFDARVTNPASGVTVADIQRVIFQFMLLDRDVGVTTVDGEAREGGHYAVSGNEMPLEGFWRLRVTVRRRGLEDVHVDFPLIRGAEAARTSDPAAVGWLRDADAAMNRLTAVRASQYMNDGTNGALVTFYDYHAPDQMRFAVEGGNASIAIGRDQYYSDKNDAWTRRDRIDPLVFPDFKTATEGQGAFLGRTDVLDGEDMQIVRYVVPAAGGGAGSEFAVWIGQADKRVRQFAMVAPAHFMMQYYADYNAADIAIQAPPNAVEASTPVPAASQNAPAPARSRRLPGVITGDGEGDIALGVLVLGLLSAVVGGDRKRSRQWRMGAMGVSLALILAAVGLFVDSLNARAAEANAPVNTQAATAGQTIYEANCLACHGAEGRGDGPAAASLATQPFDLTTHVPQHDETYLFTVISNGRGAMPAFKDKLTADDIYQVVEYLRLLAFRARQGGSAGATPAGTPAGLPGAAPGFTPGARPGFTPGAPVATPTP